MLNTASGQHLAHSAMYPGRTSCTVVQVLLASCEASMTLNLICKCLLMSYDSGAHAHLSLLSLQGLKMHTRLQHCARMHQHALEHLRF